MISTKESLGFAVLEARNFDTGFRKALNADFKCFRYEDFVKIRDSIDRIFNFDSIMESDQEDVNLLLKRIRLEIIGLCNNSSQFYKQSNLRTFVIQFIDGMLSQASNRNDGINDDKQLGKDEVKPKNFYINKNLGNFDAKKYRWLIVKLKYYFEGKIVGDDELSNLINILKQNQDAISGIHIGIVMHGIAKNVYEECLPNNILSLISILTDHLIRLPDGELSAQAIGNTLYGLQNLQDSPEVRSFISAVTRHVIIPSDRNLNSQEIGMAFYGIQNLCDSQEIRDLISAITIHIRRPYDRILDSQAIGNIFFGLQNLQDSPEVINLISTTTKHIEKLSNGSLNYHVVGMVLYGLQDFQDSPEVRGLIFAMIRHVRNTSNGNLNSQSIGMAIYGLQNLQDSLEIRGLISAITEHVISASDGDFNPQSILMVFYGLQNIQDSSEVRGLIGAITRHIDYLTDGSMSSEVIGNIFYGLQKLEDSQEVRELILVITRYINNSSDLFFDSRAIGMVFYGLQNIQDSLEVRGLILAITRHIINSPDLSLNSQQVGMALYGLQNIQDSLEVRGLILAITKHIINSPDLSLNSQQVGMALYGLQNFQDVQEAKPLIEYLFNLFDNENCKHEVVPYSVQIYSFYGRPTPKYIDDLYQEHIKTYSIPNYNEKVIGRFISNTFHNDRFLYRHYLDGFELDIYFPNEKLNIEIDGTSHYGSSSNRNKKRDLYLLKKHGVRTIRYSSFSDENALSDLENEMKRYFE